jgi:hypothetical protein
MVNTPVSFEKKPDPIINLERLYAMLFSYIDILTRKPINENKQ